MSYAMIWIEALAAMLLLLATITACVARWRRRWARAVVLMMVILPLIALAVSGWFVTLFFKCTYAMENPWFGYTLSWTILFGAGAVVLFFCGRGRAGQEPRAYAWPRGRLALGFVAAFALLYITVSNLDLAMKMQQASLRAEAGAKVLALTSPRVPDTDNAALVYVEALGAMTEPGDQMPTQTKKALSDPFAEENRPFAKDPKTLAYLASQERALTLLRKAAAMPKCSFDQEAYYELSSGSGLLYVKLVSQLRLLNAARLLALDAFVRSSSHDTRAALDDLIAVFGLARQARQANVPHLYALLVVVKIERIAAHALEEILLRHDLTPEQLERLPLGDPASYRRDMVRSLHMEEAFGLAYFALFCSDSPTVDQELLQLIDYRTRYSFPSWFVPPGALAFWRLYLMPDDLAAYRRRMARLRHLVELPYYEAYADLQTFDDDMRKGHDGILASVLSPFSYSQLFVGPVTENEATAGLTRLAVAAKLYKAKNGKYPQSMEELTPAFLQQPLLDPFDGKPLRMMHPDDGGLVLYSIGADMKDDGGTQWKKYDDGGTQWVRTKREGDIVFRLR